MTIASPSLPKSGQLNATYGRTKAAQGYLSQLERGDAQNPAPDKLHALAEFYNYPYTELMRAAGYLQTASGQQGAENTNARTSAVQAALMSANLTPEEEDAVVKYIEFLRFQHKK